MLACRTRRASRMHRGPQKHPWRLLPILASLWLRIPIGETVLCSACIDLGALRQHQVDERTASYYRFVSTLHWNATKRIERKSSAELVSVKTVGRGCCVVG